MQAGMDALSSVMRFPALDRREKNGERTITTNVVSHRATRLATCDC